MDKKIIGYTTGVFDLFHIGHLNILKTAKSKCDYLIVGVSTDELVQQYKNKVPVIPYEQRKAIIEAIKYVDMVVPQNEMDKMSAWDMYNFDVMFHGNDWQNSQLYIEIEKRFKDNNIDLVFLQHTNGISTSDIIKKIQERE